MAQKKTSSSKNPAQKAPAKKTQKAPAQKKTQAKKAPAQKKTQAKKAPAQEECSGRTAKNVPAKNVPAKKVPAKKVPAKKVPAKKAPAQKKTAAPSVEAVEETKPKGPSKEPIAPKSKPKKPTSFKIGDKVVHPHHGAAVIAKKVKQVVLGEKRDYFVLQIATDQLTVFVPIDTIDETIRPVISKTAAGRVLKTFKEEPQEAGSNWSRWYKVLNEKMTSGDIYQVAEVVRDLTFAQQTKGISPALKRMLSRARLTLTSELSFALNVDDEDATKRLDRALPKPPEEEE